MRGVIGLIDQFLYTNGVKAWILPDDSHIGFGLLLIKFTFSPVNLPAIISFLVSVRKIVAIPWNPVP